MKAASPRKLLRKIIVAKGALPSNYRQRCGWKCPFCWSMPGCFIISTGKMGIYFKSYKRVGEPECRHFPHKIYLNLKGTVLAGSCLEFGTVNVQHWHVQTARSKVCILNFGLTWVHLETQEKGPSLLSCLGWWWLMCCMVVADSDTYSVNWQIFFTSSPSWSLFLKQGLWKVQNAHLPSTWRICFMFQISQLSINISDSLFPRFTKPENTTNHFAPAQAASGVVFRCPRMMYHALAVSGVTRTKPGTTALLLDDYWCDTPSDFIGFDMFFTIILILICSSHVDDWMINRDFIWI